MLTQHNNQSHLPMKHSPCLTLTHLKTSKQYDTDPHKLYHRHWFQWSDRRQLSHLIVRIELLDADGKLVTKSSIPLPKVKVTGYSPATETDEQKPIYDGTVWIQIDDVVRQPAPTQFRYYTIVSFDKRSETVSVTMEGKYEDISHLG